MSDLRAVAAISLFILFAALGCKAVLDEQTLARVAEDRIGVDEFRKRFATTPYFKQFPDSDPQTRIVALASFLGEKIFASAARQHGLDTTGRFQAFSRQFRKEVMIEELLNEIFSEIEVADAEIAAGLRAVSRTLEVEEVVFRLLSEAEVLYASPDKFDDAETFTYTLNWGDSEPDIESVLWQLRPGEMSRPIELGGYFYVFRLQSETRNPAFRQMDPNRLKAQVQKQILRRKKRLAYRKFFKTLMAGKTTRVPSEKLREIAERMETALDVPTAAEMDSKRLQPALLTLDQYERAGVQIGSMLDKPLVRFDSGKVWLIRDFVQNLHVGPYPLNYSSKAAFRASLRNMAVMMLEHEYLYEEAGRRGLEEAPYVIETARVWDSSLLADLMRKQVVDSAAASNGSQLEKHHTTALLDEFLVRRLRQTKIVINREQFGAIELKHLEMLTFKTHFPGRPIEPAVLPLDKLPRFFEAAYEVITKE